METDLSIRLDGDFSLSRQLDRRSLHPGGGAICDHSIRHFRLALLEKAVRSEKLGMRNEEWRPASTSNCSYTDWYI